ncbi:MAG: FliH/SctL family protein [Porticoccus sp.]
MAILSEQGQTIQRWQAPFFEEPESRPAQPNPVELEALAQSRGFQVGKWDGLESGRAEAEQIVHRMTELLDEMARPYRSLDQLVTQELTQITMLLAKQIIRRELTINSDVVADIVSEAVSTLSSLEGEIEVFLNPVDMDMVSQLAPEALEGKLWKLIEDTNLLPGGCRVKTPTSYVDASVETQMEMVFDGLMESCGTQRDD